MTLRKLKPLAIIPALAIGVLVFMAVTKNKQAPEHSQIEEAARAVRVIPAPEVRVVPRALGYGYIEPAQTWQAVAEVAGKVVEIHPQLKRGAIVAKDELLLRIDPAKPELARDQMEAEVASTLAQLRELDQREANLKQSLEVESRSLEIARKELERRRALAQTGTISASEQDQQEQAYLTQRNAVQSYQSSLDLIPAERQALLASLNRVRSQLEDARLTVEKTEIRAPFDCRISQVNVEASQAVTQGAVLVQADSMSAVEVLARMPFGSLRPLVPQGISLPFFQGEKVDMERVARLLDFKAVVRVRIGDRQARWNGRVTRVAEAVDSKTRTMGIYVAVDNPYLKVKPGERPPLIRNMYAEVEIQGRPKEPSVTLPRSAVHQGVVYVVNQENRLEFRQVKPAFAMQDLVVVESGIQAGEKVVVTDLIPAVEGMLLKPVADQKLFDSLVAQAKCEENCQ